MIDESQFKNMENILYGTLTYKGIVDKLPDEVIEHDIYLCGDKVYVGLNGEWVWEDIVHDIPKFDTEYYKEINNTMLKKQILQIIDSDEYISVKELKEKIREVLK